MPAIAYKIHQANPSATLKINMKGVAIGDGLCDPVNVCVLHLLYSLYTIGNLESGIENYIQYNGNHLRKKSFVICLLCCSSLENFCDSGNLIYKNSGQDKKCKKTFANASRFAKFMKLFFLR